MAALLRAFRLDAQSLWYDEGVSAFMTTRGPAEIARAAAADIHPPLYYWLLAAWATLFGSGEVALRGLSVVLGVAMVWAIWRLGRALAGDAVGVTAGALLAVSPLAVQYSQEVRMYALAGLLTTVTTWCYVRLAAALRSSGADSTPRRTVMLAMVYATLAATLLYTHYYGLLVLLAHHVHFALMVGISRRWRATRSWIATNALAAVLYLPWIGHALRQTGYYPGLGTPQPWWALAADAVNVLSVGLATTRFGLRPGLVPFLALAVLSPFRLLPFALSLLLLWLALPIAAIILLSQTRPLYEPRFLMLVLPAWTLLVAAGGVHLATLAARSIAPRMAAAPIASGVVAAALLVGALGALLVPTTRSLAAYYFDPGYARDDYRGLATRITSLERPLDAVILTAPGQIEIFGYYYRGHSDLYPLPAQRPIDVADTLARLENVAADHRRIWLVRWAPAEADPNDEIARWLAARGRLVAAEPFGRVELRLYDLTSTAGAYRASHIVREARNDGS